MKVTKTLDDLYPDLLSAGGLAAGLQQALAGTGSPLQVRTLDEGLDSKQREVMKGFPAYARVERDERFSQVYIGAEQRMFLCDFWQRGVMLANAATPDLKELAATIRHWIEGLVTTRELAAEFSFVKPVDSAEAFESGSEVDHRWTWYEDWIPRTFPELVPFFDEAKQSPELRQLFPFTSLNCMCFSRCTGYPYTDDCPAAIPVGGIRSVVLGEFDVRLRGQLLGSGNGKEAVRITVANLPENCGPAVAGTADTVGKRDQ